MSRNDAKRPQKSEEQIPGTFESKKVDPRKETGVVDAPAPERLTKDLDEKAE